MLTVFQYVLRLQYAGPWKHPVDDWPQPVGRPLKVHAGAKIFDDSCLGDGPCPDGSVGAGTGQEVRSDHRRGVDSNPKIMRAYRGHLYFGKLQRCDPGSWLDHHRLHAEPLSYLAMRVFAVVPYCPQKAEGTPSRCRVHQLPDFGPPAGSATTEGED